jgi:hypothetical protein
VIILRKEKNGTRYFGFNEIAKEKFGITPTSKQIQNVGKRKESEQKFEKFNFCKNCKKPLSYMGGNVACCKNPDCKKPMFKLLDNKTKNYAQSVYGEMGVMA